MKWITHFQLFLFDFDGLLVNTENLHFKAYQTMCSHHGCHLDWDFITYCHYAHFDATCLQNALCKKFPLLKEIPWPILYQEKKQAYVQHLEAADDLLMPGVAPLLKELERLNISRCVVTHSSKEHVSLIRAKNPLLNTISHWITRDDYQHPKPDPECYVKAIEKYAPGKEGIIGFEDSLRGFRALQATSALPILISPMEQKNIKEFCQKPFYHFSSFEDISEL